MTRLIEVAVENELDLSLAYRKTIKAAELLRISISMRTAFATAISEVCREIIEKSLEGKLCISVECEQINNYYLVAVLQYKEVLPLNEYSEGLVYAAKLLPYFNHEVENGIGTIVLKIKVPQSAGINRVRVEGVRHYFQEIEPQTPYESLRKQNTELFKTNEQSVEALRTAEYIIEQKNEFLSVASHELKTPMTILRALTQLALKKGMDSTMSEELKKIDIQARKMQDMISQLLDVSKSEYNDLDYKFEEVNLYGFLNELQDLIKNLVPNHIFNFTGSHSISNTKLDKMRMEQVINNLVGNAAKYSKTGSSITLTFSEQIDEQAMIISIQDTGIGMEEQEVEKIFDKFYRVSQVSKKIAGLGVGLYISAKIVRDHGGEIWAESSLGKGSTFYVKLPSYPTSNEPI